MAGTVAGILYPLLQLAFDGSQAGITLPQKPVLLIGQTRINMAAVITPVSSLGQAQSLYGRGSMLALMYQAYAGIDPIGPIYCLNLPAGTTKATGTLTFTGAATASGTLYLMAAGYQIQTSVAVGDTANAVATSLAATITAMNELPVSATVASAVVTLAAKNGGTLGNQIDLRLNYFGIASAQVLPAGLTVAITAMSGGATDPDLTGIAALIADGNYRAIVHPYATAAGMSVFNTLMSFTGGRWDATRKSQGHCFTAMSDSASNLAIYGATNNDPHSTVFAYETGSPMWEPVAAAMACAASMPSLRKQPNQPLQTLAIPGFLAPNGSGAAGTETAWGPATWQLLLGKGLGVLAYDQGGNASILRAPTTYQVNPYGVPDQAYFDTEDMFLLMAQSDFLASFFTNQYGRCLIADDGTRYGAGIPVVTPKTIKAGLVAAYQQMQGLGWVEDTSAFIAATSVVRSLVEPSRVDILFAPFQVVGLRQIAVTNQFRKFSAAAAAAVTGA